MQPDAALQFQEKAEVLSGNDFALLSRRPFRKRLGVAPVGFAGPGIDRAVGHNIFAVKGVPSLQNQAVRRTSHDECGGFAFRNFPGNFPAVESRGFPEVGQEVARHKFSAATAGVIFVRRFMDDE